jgi:endonuclease/exonuclease/phosphatase family metal-dependent hydrolase
LGYSCSDGYFQVEKSILRVMKNFIPLIMLLLVYSSCGKREHELRVMTFNVRLDILIDGENRWENRIPVVKAYMDSVAPDIAGMQEVLHNQLIDLLDIMPGYAYVGSGRDDGREAGEYSPVFYREERFKLHDHSQFWLSETPEIPGSKSWDAAITRVVAWAALEDIESGKLFYVFNTHFDHRGKEARLKSAELISERIAEVAGNSPVILVGDFNIREESDDYTYMANLYSRNGLRNTGTISPRTGLQSTFNGFRTDLDAGVIDFIFVDENFEVGYHRVDEVIENGIFISDHWPVVAGISFTR